VTARFEVYAAGPADPERVWALVGDLRRLPEWTDADSVEELDAGPPAVGTTFVTRVGGRRLGWRVRTLEPRLIEAATWLPGGVLGIGVRVVAGEDGGSRVILAGAYAPNSRRSSLRFSLSGGPRLRRRFDRWSPVAARGGQV
jgi:uncharacterized membrane protein